MLTVKPGFALEVPTSSRFNATVVAIREHFLLGWQVAVFFQNTEGFDLGLILHVDGFEFIDEDLGWKEVAWDRSLPDVTEPCFAATIGGQDWVVGHDGKKLRSAGSDDFLNLGRKKSVDAEFLRLMCNAYLGEGPWPASSDWGKSEAYFRRIAYARRVGLIGVEMN